ncbi:MAG: pyridoxamine 5'-phosphate oxidase [Candidatus Pelagibacter sp. TMED118]|nr:MAG: pyridoxamine 5'-phosphate oxidase [Candidatus Pelagibacter sp. TMED118]RPG99861.1 MAG: pyridoxamine 5'-phosphate oxidase [Candidatus Pelagibacter sp. TMED118]|tara:strand:+ start:1407 stop:2033 length:627 start_codon:yes stop_codon:yes gene_type:complete
MNQKNSLGLNICFGDTDKPIDLFKVWFEEAVKAEINDPNAVALATSDVNLIPTVRMVLLKDFSSKGFVFYTNLNSKKSDDLKNNPNASMCFHWKSLLRQIRIVGTINSVNNKDADDYYNSRAYRSRIGAWASNQSKILKNRDELYKNIEEFKKKYPDEEKVPRPPYWSGWILEPKTIEFWLDGENRIHERLKYKKNGKDLWEKFLLSP